MITTDHRWDDLRAEIRAFMEEHAAPYGPRVENVRMDDTDEFATSARAWQRTLFDGGYGATTWPKHAGGCAFGPVETTIFREEESKWNVPTGMFAIGVQLVGPTLLAHGTDEQRARFLRPMSDGTHIWCQLFSEPDAGSDLASLRTRATPDSDEWVVSGQKVWTSGAASADCGILLARTEAGATRHGGVSFFVVDMRSPGIEIRPITQINGARHFNEVHFDEVRLPADAIVGSPGEGWHIARTTLSAERVLIGTMSVADRLDKLLHERGASTMAAPRRDQMVATYCRSRALDLTSARVLAEVSDGGAPGPEAAVLKLSLSTLAGELGELAMTIGGADGMLAGAGKDGYGPLQDLFLGQWSSRIGGGTEQIQRNLIGERALGLPRDPRPPTTAAGS